MNTATFETFQADALAAGIDEVLERRWAPDTVIATHAHAFGVEAMMRQGEMCLHFERNTLHLMPGNGFTLPAGVPHDERYGVDGATPLGRAAQRTLTPTVLLREPVPECACGVRAKSWPNFNTDQGRSPTAGATTCSSTECGARSRTRRSTCVPTRPSRTSKHALPVSWRVRLVPTAWCARTKDARSIFQPMP